MEITPDNNGAEVLKTQLPDIGHLATWSVSSFKYGFGVECLRDDDSETFWQSDGPQPHLITLQFSKKVSVQSLAINLNFVVDDSYTPVKLGIRAGTGLYDLQEILTVSLDKPRNWITFDVGTEANEEGPGSKPIDLYVIQIVILSNHMNGKDTHVRGLRVLGPRMMLDIEDDTFPFTSLAFKMHEHIR